jgi:hypothetical protein
LRPLGIARLEQYQGIIEVFRLHARGLVTLATTPPVEVTRAPRTPPTAIVTASFFFGVMVSIFWRRLPQKRGVSGGASSADNGGTPGAMPNPSDRTGAARRQPPMSDRIASVLLYLTLSPATVADYSHLLANGYGGAP